MASLTLFIFLTERINFCLFQTTQFLVFCKASPRKLVQKEFWKEFLLRNESLLARELMFLARWSLKRKQCLNLPPLPQAKECLLHSSSQLSSSWGHGHRQVVNACLKGINVRVMPTEYSKVHGSDLSHYKLINLSVCFANTNIPLRDRPAYVIATSGLRVYKALISDISKFTSLRSLLENNCQSSWLRHHSYHSTLSLSFFFLELYRMDFTSFWLLLVLFL